MSRHHKRKYRGVACKRCGWDGALRIWGGRFGPYLRNPQGESDPMKRGRPVPRSWRDGVCAYCVWREMEDARHGAQ